MNRLLQLSLLVSLLFAFSCCRKTTEGYHINSFQNFSRTFNDLNDAHLTAAHKIGINPIASRAEAEKQTNKLSEVETCRYYRIDSLTNSVPFLVKKASKLLKIVGENFQDSLENKNAPKYKIIITSILRTHDDIKKLRRKNGNSSLNSAHLFGTTFDVAYARFEKKDEDDPNVPEDKLKAVLAEVLRDLQKQGKCYVRYEVKQGCFHITARP